MKKCCFYVKFHFLFGITFYNIKKSSKRRIHYEKTLVLFLTCVFTFCVFVGCENRQPETSSDFIEGVVFDPIESYDNVSFFVPEEDDSTAVSEESSEPDVSDTASTESSKPDISDTTSEESSKPDVSDTTSTESSEPDENGSTSDESQGEKPNVGGFLVMDKKYTYKGKNVVIVNVENQTNKNYTVRLEKADKQVSTL